jgi:hypothetical protein
LLLSCLGVGRSQLIHALFFIGFVDFVLQKVYLIKNNLPSFVLSDLIL